MNYTALIVSFLIALSAGWIGALFTVDASSTWYLELIKAPLNPPSYVFAPVWTILYLLIGYASYLVWMKRGVGSTPTLALGLYVAQLALNALWSVVFFGLHSPEIAFVIILLLFIALCATGALFYKVEKKAGLLFIPYVLWVLFASYLNLYIVIVN